MSRYKHLEESFFKALITTVTVGIVLLLCFIVAVIFRKGLPALSWEMISRIPEGGFYFGKEGGILNAIAGSFYLALGATGMALLLSLPLALFMNIYLSRNARFLTLLRFILDTLWGIPSIVYGAFGFTVMIFLNTGTSLIAGMITVGLLIAPIMIRAMDEVLRSIPKGLLESTLALGSTYTETAFVVYLRQALPGFITAVLLAFGRGIGDAASVLFTAGYTDYLPARLSDPVATLPLAIFFQLSSPIPEVRERAYAAAVVLTLIILLISLISRSLSKRFNKNII